MNLESLIGKTCVIGLSYFDPKGTLLKQAQYGGTVVKADAELGITVQLAHSNQDAGEPEFILPPNLTPWFKAPAGRYRHPPTGLDLSNPDFLVTWDIHRTQEQRADGQHEWWEWVPNAVPPQVGNS